MPDASGNGLTCIANRCAVTLSLRSIAFVRTTDEEESISNILTKQNKNIIRATDCIVHDVLQLGVTGR